ncbi:MAG TPA: hypothetical protein VK730_07180 [Solirubrobacteraceae bacterium]|jgi:hypothetical protein|nr:hypothetical protein [Solirubrobacteraceae bacterium]
MTGRQLHRAGTTVLSLAMVAIGIALIVEALVGEGVLSIRVLLGFLFVVAGSGRMYVDVRRGRGI